MIATYNRVFRRIIAARAAARSQAREEVFALQRLGIMIACRFVALAWLAAVVPPSMAEAQVKPPPPCNEYSQSGAVFVGTARAPVMRTVQLPLHPPLQMKLTPIEVERAYLGVTTPVVYVTPLGVETYATAGRRYLVYGRSYNPPDIVMASPGNAMKEVEEAAEDLAFLESLTPGSGGTIAGTVEQKEIVYGQTLKDRGALPDLTVRIANETRVIDTTTDAAGHFIISGLPDGVYELTPQLPDGLSVLDPTSRIHALVREGGCANVIIKAVFNGRVRGVLRGPDGRPLPYGVVELIPMDIAPDSTGHIPGSSSTSPNGEGEFEFAGRPPGRYYLGMKPASGGYPNEPSYPLTYYPGTLDRDAAVPVVIDRGRASEFLDFSIPTIFRKDPPKDLDR